LNKENLIIIGGTGFIGFNLIKKFTKKKKFNILSLSSSKPSKHRKLRGVKYLICDIFKKKKLEIVLNKEKIDYVINLAGYVDHKNKDKTYKSHYIGCKNLIEILIKKKIKRFIQIGSSVEYGFKKSPQNENCKINIKDLKSSYGQAKLSATNLLVNTFKKENFPAVVLRLYIAYGPYQNINRFIPEVINACLKNKVFNCSHGRQVRDFLYINDLVDLIYKCLKIKNMDGKIFNVGSGRKQIIKNIIQSIIKKTSGGKPRFGKIKLRRDEPLKLYPNTSKIRKFINWKPKISFDKGLDKTIKYYKNAQ
jgi:nucleoside-diphosphate-sugar epimerase